LESRVEDPLPDALRVAEGQVAMKKRVPSAAHVDGNEQLQNSTNEVDTNFLQKTYSDKDNQVQCLETKGVDHQNGFVEKLLERPGNGGMARHGLCYRYITV